MKNPATHSSKDDFNSFTELLYMKLMDGKNVYVKLRDGRILKLEYFVGTGFDEGYNYFCNTENGNYLIWKNDGTSITSRDFDIMEDIEQL